jgi:hypothetical protein
MQEEDWKEAKIRNHSQKKSRGLKLVQVLMEKQKDCLQKKNRERCKQPSRLFSKTIQN